MIIINVVLLTTEEAAGRLGVKVQTVYAYVSRGVLTSVRSGDGRTSLFDPDEVEALARRGRPRRTSRPPMFEIQIDTALTSLGAHAPLPGQSAVALAGSATFEQVAELCWTGTLPDSFSTWRGSTVVLPDHGDLLDLVRVAVALAALDDPSAPTSGPARSPPAGGP